MPSSAGRDELQPGRLAGLDDLDVEALLREPALGLGQVEAGVVRVGRPVEHDGDLAGATDVLVVDGELRVVREAGAAPREGQRRDDREGHRTDEGGRGELHDFPLCHGVATRVSTATRAKNRPDRSAIRTTPTKIWSTA